MCVWLNAKCGQNFAIVFTEALGVFVRKLKNANPCKISVKQESSVLCLNIWFSPPHVVDGKYSVTKR